MLKELNKDLIISKLQDLAIPTLPQAYIFDSIDSTNNFLKNLEDKDFSFCAANTQTKGRGRNSKTWDSPKLGNIYLSCLFPILKSEPNICILSLIVGLKIINTLEKLSCGINLKLKWPNDLLHENKKLCGILIELQDSKDYFNAIIGIGLNLNQYMDNNIGLERERTSLYTITHKKWCINHVIAEIINDLYIEISNIKNQELANFVSLYEKYDYLKNKFISIEQNSITYQGIAKGISCQGALLLEDNKNNTITKFYSGTVLSYSSN